MAFNDISLTSGMRNNLVSLQNTVTLLNRTQDRLSSGKKVNTALDNPVSFFAAQSLNSRASDLNSYKDGMGQAVQAINAANSGISGITALIESARGVAQAATADVANIATYGATFDAIVSQIDTMAQDSGYQGINLLNGDNLTVAFGGNGTLTVTGATATSTGLGMTAGAGLAWAGAGDATTSIGELDTAKTNLKATATSLSSNLSIISARQDFTTSLVNTLTQGADKLTLADMNEEGANMLMLQTRQSLGTTALSLSAQAAQSVLKLF